jgi:lipoprotein-releasing system permease protein
LAPGADIAQTKKELRSAIGNKYNVLDRYEQQEDVFHIMEIEKLIAYIFLSFILLVSCFNIISSLSMLIIDKKADVQTLINLGANNKQIVHIFMLEGILISLMGALLGIGTGTLLCYLQQTYGLISLGKSAGSFVVDAYPVSVQGGDLVIVLVTVLVVGYLATLYPVRYFSHKLLAQQ